MIAPNAYISLHNVGTLTAFADNSFSTPLMLSIDGAHGKMRIALFFADTGDDYATRLAEAINAVPLRLPPPVPDAAHHAAHHAANAFYGSQP